MKKRILIVDDEIIVAKVIAQMLAVLGGYETRTINQAELAVAAALEYRADAVVLDYRMPGMNGDEVLSALRQCSGYEQVPAILLTGDNSWESIKSDEITQVLQKPLTAEVLIAAARALLDSAGEPENLAG